MPPPTLVDFLELKYIGVFGLNLFAERDGTILFVSAVFIWIMDDRFWIPEDDGFITSSGYSTVL